MFGKIQTVTIPKDGVKDRSRRVQIRSGSGTEETSESQKGSPAASDDGASDKSADTHH